MRLLLGTSLITLITAASPSIAQDISEDRSAVEKTMNGFIEARNARDAERTASFFADDYDQGNLAIGEVQIKSGTERYQAYERAFREGRMRNRMAFESNNYRLLSGDVAILDATLSFLNPDGEEELVNYATFIFVKRDGSWLIGAVRLSPRTPG